MVLDRDEMDKKIMQEKYEKDLKMRKEYQSYQLVQMGEF